MWNSFKICELLGGKLIGDGTAVFNGCQINSRLITGGELFVALPGQKSDGHHFIKKALEQGANVILGERSRLGSFVQDTLPEGKAIIAVNNSLTALHSLAQAWKEKLDPIVVAVTGSNGKTTTKDMIAAVLDLKYRVHKNRENHNTEIGLPMTILNAQADTEVLVLEMGMRGRGQIKLLCDICKPDIGVITNIGTTHLELLGSQENIAQAKWELIESLPAEGTAVLNSEDFYSVEKAKKTRIAKVFYGTKGRYITPQIQAVNLRPAEMMGTIFTVIENGAGDNVAEKSFPSGKSEENSLAKDFREEISLPLPGEHNVLDALAALSVGRVLGLNFAQSSAAFKDFKISKMRLELLQGVNDSIIISDVYNANPASMKASLKVLKERGKTKTIAVLGEMYELGEAASSGHLEVGHEVNKLGISYLITVGRLAEKIAEGAIAAGYSPDNVRICSNCEEAAAAAENVIKELSENTWVLVKGSRGMEMETVSSYLQVEK